MGGPASWLAFAALAWSAYEVLRRRFRLAADEAFLAAGLVAVFEAISTSFLLGSAGFFTRRPVLLAAAMIVVTQALAAALDDPPRASRSRRASPWPRVLWPALAFVAAVLLVRLVLAAAVPTESWDGLSYHMPILWRWVDQGNFNMAGWSGPQRWFPWNGELFPAWLAVLDGRSLDASKLAQAVALPLLGGAGAVLGRRLAGRAWSAACALAFAALPIAMIHAGVPYVDGLHAAFWLSAAAFAAAWDRSGRKVHLLLCALSFGLTLGTKSTVYFLAPLAIPILAPLVRPDRRGRFLRWLTAATVVGFVSGGISYARNWVVAGSPIFPYSLRVGGVKIFSGPLAPGELLVSVERWFVSTPRGWLSYPFRETMRGTVGYSTENGFGPIFAAGWLLLPWAAYLCWRRRSRAGLAFLALAPATAFFFETMHPTREPRYVIFLAGVPIVALAMALRGLRGRSRTFALGLWALGVSWGALGVADFLARDPGLSKARAALKRDGFVDPHQYYRWQYGSLGEAWAFLDARLQPGDAVALNYGELMQPWAGTPPRAKVFIVGRRPNDLPETLWAESDADWLDLLRRLHARYYALWTPVWYPDVGAAERATIAARPDVFTSLGTWDSGGFGRVQLFELKR
ncbi:MAG: hypothetical protein ACHQ51_00815 [Elusimicrobiota bacterium]